MKLRTSKAFQYQTLDNYSKLNPLMNSARTHNKTSLTESKNTKEILDSRNHKAGYSSTETNLRSPRSNTSDAAHLKSKPIQESHTLKLRESMGGTVYSSNNTRVLRTTQKQTVAKQEPLRILNINSLSELNVERQGKSLTAREMGSGELALRPGKEILAPNYKPAKCSLKGNGLIKAYAVNTNKGLVRYLLPLSARNYNEDRVSIILNIAKPADRTEEVWPKCSFFGVYDGHGGSGCADFLRDNLHLFVIKEPCFPHKPMDALIKGFEAAEKKFMELCQSNDQLVDRSGSCALTVLIVNDTCYIANVGDSRAVLSM
eukprot:TRINITY_DN8147_c0_g1_i29.p1 TRINITY_DN8147_c0_g1~~TRINITY_DN8147_c0_g1_i29.p1  ORF type:complete len:316 (-),score=57.49 TRINITY_DN8147_c0_g1_i29:324-1271(-)